MIRIIFFHVLFNYTDSYFCIANILPQYFWAHVAFSVWSRSLLCAHMSPLDDSGDGCMSLLDDYDCMSLFGDCDDD